MGAIVLAPTAAPKRLMRFRLFSVFVFIIFVRVYDIEMNPR